MYEIVLGCAAQQAEELADWLLDHGALSVSIEDADRETDEEQPLYGEPGYELDVAVWARNELTALVADPEMVSTLQHHLLMHYGADEVTVLRISELEPQDWVRQTQAQFDPIELGERLWIVPSWHRDHPQIAPLVDDPTQILIQLDPGLAFGTGSHATTRLCGQWLMQHPLAGQQVLDYGCGSGILSIIAAKLGAAKVLGVDIDPQSVETARYNAQVNGCEIHSMQPHELGPGEFDVVVANILANPLKLMASMLAHRVRPGGHLVLSGILEWQVEELRAAYADWLDLIVWDQSEGWVCLHAQRD